MKPYKFQVVAVVQTVDENGVVTGEAETSPVILFGCAALEEWAREFPATLAEVES